jgi:hypothetical protein
VGTLLAQLDSGCLLLAGADFYSAESWSTATSTGADVVWALPNDVTLPRGVHYSDGSYASTVLGSVAGSAARDVRVIEARSVTSESDAAAATRYVTTIADPLLASAADLVALFGKQRSLAAAFDEFRAHSDSGRIVLRSKIPDGVRQEIYGFLCVHYAMRRLMNAPPVGSEQASLTQP